MADNQTSQTQAPTGNLYPLTKMNFIVSVDGYQGTAAFSEVTGVESSVDVIEFRQGNSSLLSPLKLPGLVKHGNVTLKMGFISGEEIRKWLILCVSEQRGAVSALRKNVTIELLDIATKGSPTTVNNKAASENIAWLLKNAWVAKYTATDLNASASEVAIESIEIAYEELTIAK